jgi:hypothetical protein
MQDGHQLRERRGGEKKRPYIPPTIQSRKVLERAALACGREAYNNTQVDLKDNWASCGFNDS